MYDVRVYLIPYGVHMLYSLHIHIYMQRCSTKIRRWALSGCLSAPPHCWIIADQSILNAENCRSEYDLRHSTLQLSSLHKNDLPPNRTVRWFCNRKGLSEVLIRGWKAYFSYFLACELTYLGHIMHLCSNPFTICIVVWGSWKSKSLKAVSSKHMWHPSPSALSEITREHWRIMNDHCVLYHLYKDPNALIEGAKQKLPSSTFRCAFEQGILYVQYICTYITGVGPYGYAARWGRLRCSGSTELPDLFYSSVESSEQWAMTNE